MRYLICLMVLISTYASAVVWHFRCEDRALTPNKKYLVYGKTSERVLETNYFIAIDNYWDNRKFTMEFSKGFIITHWMELPLLPISGDR